MAFEDFERKELTQSAPPIQHRSRPFKARRADHLPHNVASVAVAIPPAPVEVKAEENVKVNELKEPITPFNSRQNLETMPKTPGMSSPPSLQRRSRRIVEGGRLAPRTHHAHRFSNRPRSQALNLGICMKTLRIRRQ